MRALHMRRSNGTSPDPRFWPDSAVRLFLLLLLPMTLLATPGKRFTFAALGCMPYGLPATGPAFTRVIEEIDRHAPAFTVHCGDIKGGAEPSSLEGLDTMRDYFMRFEGPLIYTPGDNEWTDVHRPAAGGHDPILWLGHLLNSSRPDPLKIQFPIGIGCLPCRAHDRAVVGIALEQAPASGLV